MPLATVLIPTYDHQDLILRAIESVKRQSIQDFELFVVGDGAPKRTRKIMKEVCRADPRARFFKNKKGPRTGEIYRHAALQEARGKFVCYLGDDDLWLPHHLEIMARHLQAFDFCHTIQVYITAGEELLAVPCDLDNAKARSRMLNSRFNMFGLSVAGHRMDFYQKLPHGWRSAPEDLWTDLYMWRQCLSVEDCRFKTIFEPSVIKFENKSRKDMSLESRCAEMDKWLEKMAQPGFLNWWHNEVFKTLCATLLEKNMMIKKLKFQVQKQELEPT